MKKIKQGVFSLMKRTQIIQGVIKVLFHLSSILPVRKGTVVFESFHGKQYSDNPKAIYNYMKEHHPNYKLYWSFDRSVFNNFKVNERLSLKRLGIKWIFVMSRAEYWVTNSRLPLWIPKRKSTTYIQTWHGTPLKKLGLDIEELHMPNTNTAQYKAEFAYESSKWDYLISPNSYSTDIFRKAFDFKQEILETGYPRNDILYSHNNKEDIKRIKNNLGLPMGKKIILYAPTWRDNAYHSVGKYKLNLHMDLSLMKKSLGDDYIILIRAHYLVADNLDLTDYDEFVYDYSLYKDISHLYLISDILITDYSSVFFDYANLQRPILFFAYDIEEYRNELRGFYLDYERIAPGPLIKTTGEVVKEIKSIESNGFIMTDTYKSFLDKYCYLEDGNASERVVKKIIIK